MQPPLIRFHKWIKKTSKRGKEYWRSINLGVYSLNGIRYNRKNGQEYPNLNMHTEKELVHFIKNNWGFGNYSVIAHIKNRNGAYLFWKGDITEDGWVFNQKETLNQQEKKEIEEYEKDINIAEDEEEVGINKMLIDSVKQEAKERKNRYGFQPFLKPSGVRGSVNFWHEEEFKEEPIQQKDWVSNELEVTKQERKKFESLSLDDINRI